MREPMKKYDAVIAGYLCVDLIPEFKKNETHASIADVLKPGKLIEIDGLNSTLGGIVANTGMAMKKFSKNVFLNGLIGDDFIGKIAMEWLDKYGLSGGIKTVHEPGTAFGLVIAPPGVDRIFLESPGCSQLFDDSHIRYDAIAQSRLFHFGYPPLLKQFYLNEGSQLKTLMSRVQQMNVVTSLDFSLPDPDSESAKVRWPEVLKKVLPFTDIFAPSLEEALLIMMPGEYARIQSSLGDADLIDQVSVETIRQAGKLIIASGAKIALIKAGHRGAYLWAGDVSSLNEKSGFHLSIERWNHCELWCPAYPVDEKRVKNASGAGDTAVAAFLAAILDGEDPERCLRYAALAGRNNLYCYNIFNEISSWDEMTGEIRRASAEKAV
jgi:sugar/nucleoside kinase (ribokinase family)